MVKDDCMKILYELTLCLFLIYPYPVSAENESSKPLPPVQGKATLHTCAIWTGSILLAGQLQSPFKKFSSLRVQ